MPVRLQVAVKLLVAVSASLLGASCIQHDDAVGASVIGESRDLVATQQRLSAIAERHGLDPARYIDEPQNAIDRGSSSAIQRLADDLRYGATPPSSRRNWHVEDDDHSDAGDGVLRAAASDVLANQLEAMAPKHAQYEALKSRLAAVPKTDSPERRLLRINLDRWRWMPNELGSDYIFVNAPSFEAIIVRNGKIYARHRAIIGSRSTPTPQFSAWASGVRVRPTWFVPQSIVRESVGSLIKNDAARAAQLGYVESKDGSIRQMPGPANALGEMILVMPNRFSVFLHDTPSKALFNNENRALSHGCIRIERAGEFAKALLAAPKKIDDYDAALAAGKTKTIRFEEPIPVYIGYFTALADDAGEIRYYPDVYGFDEDVLVGLDGADLAASDRSDFEGCPLDPATPD